MCCVATYMYVVAILAHAHFSQVEYSEEQGTMVQFNYPLEKLPNDDCGTQFLPVCTTRLETVLADSAIAVHPEDPRWAELIGRYAVVPYTGRRIRIIADEYVNCIGCLACTV